MKSSKAILHTSTIFLGLFFCINAQALTLSTGTCTYPDDGVEKKFVWCTSDDRAVAPYTSFGVTQNIIIEKDGGLCAAYGKFINGEPWNILKRGAKCVFEATGSKEKIVMTKCDSNPSITVAEASVTTKTCKEWIAANQ